MEPPAEVLRRTAEQGYLELEQVRDSMGQRMAWPCSESLKSDPLVLCAWMAVRTSARVPPPDDGARDRTFLQLNRACPRVCEVQILFLHNDTV